MGMEAVLRKKKISHGGASDVTENKMLNSAY